MANTTLDRELLDLERQYWQAIKEKDAAKAARLTDEECIVTGAQGVGRINRQAMSQMLKSATWTLNDFEPALKVEGRGTGGTVA